jgi:hypothetical protein
MGAVKSVGRCVARSHIVASARQLLAAVTDACLHPDSNSRPMQNRCLQWNLARINIVINISEDGTMS